MIPMIPMEFLWIPIRIPMIHMDSYIRIPI